MNGVETRHQNHTREIAHNELERMCELCTVGIGVTIGMMEVVDLAKHEGQMQYPMGDVEPHLDKHHEHKHHWYNNGDRQRTRGHRDRRIDPVGEWSTKPKGVADRDYAR